jgi:hypothetical protein
MTIKQSQQKQEKITLGAQDFRRLDTLLDPRAKDDPKFLGQASPALKLLTANLYQQKIVSLPLTQTDFDALFPCNMNVFAQTQPDVVTNIADDATIDCQFLLTGVGLMVTLPSRSYTMPGIMVPSGDGTTPTPCNTGCTTSASQTNAALAYGYPARMAMEAFLASRRVQMYLCRRFQVFDEAARDMGLVTTLAEFIGASDSLYSVMPDVAKTNDVLTARGCTKQFIPQNAISGTSGSECLGAPLAGVTYGSTRMLGVGQKFYRLNTPVLYTQGMKLDFRFICEDGSDCFQDEMQRSLVIDCDNPTKPSSTFTSTLACGVGSAGVFTVPGGCFQFGLVLAGYDIAPACVLEYYNGLDPNSPVAAALRETPGGVGANIMSILAQNPHLRGRLAGMPNVEQWLKG